MTVNHPQGIDLLRALTIAREYGSGGREVASRLALQLGWRVVDHDIVSQVARELGVSEREAEEHDERPEGLVSRILSAMQNMAPPIFETPLPMGELGEGAISSPYHEAVHHVLESLAREGRVVIVGRAGHAHLASHPDVMHVRVVAPLEQRIANVSQREGLDIDAARARVQAKDHDRHQHLLTEHHVQVDDPHLYDLIVNMRALSLDAAVALILDAMAAKAAGLASDP